MVAGSRRARQPRPRVREGPLRLRLRDACRPRPQAHDPQDHRVTSGARSPGKRRSATRRASSAASRRSTAATRSAASPLRAAPTRRPSSCRRWCAPPSATTMSIPAPGSAIRPTGYGLKSTMGESAGTQAFISVAKADVIMVVGANPTDGHPVFASQMKQRLRQGAKLIVLDPRAIGLVRSPHIAADVHLQLTPGTNVAVLNAIAHVIVTEGLTKDDYVAERCEPESYQLWKELIAAERNSPEAMEAVTGVPAELVRRAARLYAAGPNGAIYYGLGVTEHSQGSTAVMALANLAMAPAISAARASASIRCAARTTSRARATWAPSRTSSAPTGTCPTRWCAACSSGIGASRCSPSRASNHQHVRGGARRHLPRHVRAGGGLRAVRPQHASRHARHGVAGVRDRAGPVPQRDGEVRARVPAGLLVPREGRHLHQRGAAHLARAQDHAAQGGLRGLAGHHAAVGGAGLSDALPASRPRSWTRSRG